MCSPRVVFPVICLLLIAVPLLLMPPVPAVDACAEHGHEHDNGDGQGDETGERHARALDAVGPGGLSHLVTP